MATFGCSQEVQPPTRTLRLPMSFSAVPSRAVLFAGFLTVVVTQPGAAQSRQGARPAMAREAEIALARSAAPPAVSSKARVWIWTGDKYVVADSGTVPVNCYVGRPWVPSAEPHCLDAEGSATILPIMMRRVELYAQGKNDADTEREIADGIASGKFRLPQRPAVTYMMSAAQQLVNGQGSAVGAWQPHLMIYFPNLTTDGVGLPGFVPDLGFVENPGQALSALVIPLKSFVADPAKK
jgi:hypothetical protein